VRRSPGLGTNTVGKSVKGSPKGSCWASSDAQSLSKGPGRSREGALPVVVSHPAHRPPLTLCRDVTGGISRAAGSDPPARRSPHKVKRRIAPGRERPRRSTVRSATSCIAGCRCSVVTELVFAMAAAKSAWCARAVALARYAHWRLDRSPPTVGDSKIGSSQPARRSLCARSGPISSQGDRGRARARRCVDRTQAAPLLHRERKRAAGGPHPRGPSRTLRPSRRRAARSARWALPGGWRAKRKRPASFLQLARRFSGLSSSGRRDSNPRRPPWQGGPTRPAALRRAAFTQVFHPRRVPSVPAVSRQVGSMVGSI
jgi:hypothetical protein